MNILYLGKQSGIINFLTSHGHNVTKSISPIVVQYEMLGYDCIISYGYRHKIPMFAVDAVNGRAVNLHISYLPYNRGANPNYWSWHDDTPKGVTIHYIDDGFDTGDIIVQKLVDLNPADTLRQTYDTLSREIESLFIDNWDRLFTLPRHPQQGEGTVHMKSDSIELIGGWDMPCDMIGKDIFGWDN